MDEKRLVIIGVGVVLLVSTITLLAVTMSASRDQGDGETSVKANRTNPLLLISLDGFRSDYFFRYVPTLEKMAKNGVKARFMMPSYPTITFPNHYTIVTGLYPESHGIVANSFYDPVFNGNFSMGMGPSTGKWWGGEPIWNTLTHQNKTSATYFWPGSDKDISGLFPTEYRQFNKEISFEDRVDKVVEWLSRPEETRPDWVSLYLEEPDTAGHENGPDSLAVDNMLVRVDGMIARLLSGLRRNGMEDKVNIIVLADHGMAQAGPDKNLDLATYVPDIYTAAPYISYGAFSMLKLQDQSEASINSKLQALSCPTGAPYMRAFLPQDLPTRFHFSNNRRIGDIVLVFDSGYYTGWLEYGDHGYDNHQHSMEALFIATGPDFKTNHTLEPFQNIEIYNLLCLLTDVEPAPNNGTEGALYDALIDPPDTPEVPMEDEPPTAEYPAGGMTNETWDMTKCRQEPITANERDQLQNGLNISLADQDKLLNLHLPLGIPLTGNLSADVLLLYHKDHVTGYSQKLKMPLWTSFTVSEMPTSSNETVWLSDLRLNKTNTQTCDSYNKSLTMLPLFPPELSTDEAMNVIPYLVSNAVPMHSTINTLDYLDNFLQTLEMNANMSFNVLLGPVFDNDADSLPDDFSNFTIPQVPSDLFMVITRCKDVGVSLHSCKNESLDTFSFIFPEHQTANNNCRNDPEYAITMFLSTMHDVELASGLTFLPALEASTRLRLALKIHTDLRQIIIRG